VHGQAARGASGKKASARADVPPAFEDTIEDRVADLLDDEDARMSVARHSVPQLAVMGRRRPVHDQCRRGGEERIEAVLDGRYAMAIAKCILPVPLGPRNTRDCPGVGLVRTPQGLEWS
jgi:hypothetical protein